MQFIHHVAYLGEGGCFGVGQRPRSIQISKFVYGQKDTEWGKGAKNPKKGHVAYGRPLYSAEALAYSEHIFINRILVLSEKTVLGSSFKF